MMAVLRRVSRLARLQAPPGGASNFSHAPLDGGFGTRQGRARLGCQPVESRNLADTGPPLKTGRIES